MDDEKYKKLSDLTRNLTSMTYVLQYYCQFFEGSSYHIAYLYEYTKMLNKKAFELYELL